MSILEIFAVINYREQRMIYMWFLKKYVKIVYEDMGLFDADVIVANKCRKM